MIDEQLLQSELQTRDCSINIISDNAGWGPLHSAPAPGQTVFDKLSSSVCSYQTKPDRRRGGAMLSICPDNITYNPRIHSQLTTRFMNESTSSTLSTLSTLSTSSTKLITFSFNSSSSSFSSLSERRNDFEIYHDHDQCSMLVHGVVSDLKQT